MVTSADNKPPGEGTLTAHEAFQKLYRAAEEVYDARHDYPTDIDPGTSYRAAMDDLGDLLVTLADFMPEPAWLSEATASSREQKP